MIGLPAQRHPQLGLSQVGLLADDPRTTEPGADQPALSSNGLIASWKASDPHPVEIDPGIENNVGGQAEPTAQLFRQSLCL